jgi:hypothetical protein
MKFRFRIKCSSEAILTQTAVINVCVTVLKLIYFWKRVKMKKQTKKKHNILRSVLSKIYKQEVLGRTN